MSEPDNKTPISLDKVKRYSLKERKSKVTVRNFARPHSSSHLLDWLDSLSDILSAKDLKEIIKIIANAAIQKKMIILGMGAHPIKLGLSRIIIDLMRRGIIKGIATNGACIIHDTEIAMIGHTSEDVAKELKTGRFGMAKETAQFLNSVISDAYKKGIGLGEAVGKMILKGDFPYKEFSIFANAYDMNVPAMVHVAIGTDIIHMHPESDPAAIGATSHIDFRIFARLVSQLEHGVFINLGSAVIIPEVFLKALSLVRNLGYNVYRFTTVNLDFNRQYRAVTNIVERPTMHGGKGFYIIGHNEITFPLIASLVIEYMNRRLKQLTKSVY